MATNELTITNRRTADKWLFIFFGTAFPLLILVAYAKSYYLKEFFDSAPIATSIVHFHALTMSAWVLYFTVQIVLIRTRNVKLHMTFGMVGVGLAALVVLIGMAAAVDSHLIRKTGPPGIDPYGFFLVPIFDMVIFVVLLSAAIWYRKRPAEHKTLMLLTAINFLPAAFVRLPILPSEFMILQAYAFPDIIALSFLAWHSIKNRRFNKVFALGIAVMIVSQPLRVVLAGTETWRETAAWIASTAGAN